TSTVASSSWNATTPGCSSGGSRRGVTSSTSRSSPSFRPQKRGRRSSRCCDRPAGPRGADYTDRVKAPRAAVYLTHLGAAGWEITDGERVILLDPYFSRLRITGQFGTYTTPALPGDARRVFGPDDDLGSETAAVDAYVTRADFILHSHSHFNHTIDMPYIAKKEPATGIAW